MEIKEEKTSEFSNNSIPLDNMSIEFSLNSIIAYRKANQILFSKCSGQITGQILLNKLNFKETEEIKR